MTRIISGTDITSPSKLEPVINSLRETFAEVFSHHYEPKLIDPELKQGFSDIIAKHFPGGAESKSKDERIRKLREIYRGGGFDDEAAFLKMWINKTEDCFTEAYLAEARESKQFSKDELDECSGYLRLIDQNRRLKKVDFCAVVNENHKVISFIIYHVFEQTNPDTQQKQQVIHMRQSASLMQRKGHVKKLLQDIAKKYPNAYIECNRRKFNDHIPFLFNSNYFIVADPNFGYSKEYYSCYQSKLPLKELEKIISWIVVKRAAPFFVAGALAVTLFGLKVVNSGLKFFQDDSTGVTPNPSG